PARIEPKDEIGKFGDLGDQRLGMPLEHRLAPPGYALVRLHLKEEPAWCDDKGAKRGNLHSSEPCRCASRIGASRSGQPEVSIPSPRACPSSACNPNRVGRIAPS